MNGNMNGKDFFELLGNLDEDIVEDAWTEESGIVTIIEERSPLSFWKIAAAAAACIALITVGVYSSLKLRPDDVVSPGESDVTYIESSSAESSETESNVHGNISKIPPNPENTIVIGETNLAEKQDNEDYAVIYVAETNASEDTPIYITIYAFYYGAEEDKPVSETVKITGSGEYNVHYTRPWGAGTMNCLRIKFGDDFTFDPILNGTWIP